MPAYEVVPALFARNIANWQLDRVSRRLHTYSFVIVDIASVYELLHKEVNVMPPVVITRFSVIPQYILYLYDSVECIEDVKGHCLLQMYDCACICYFGIESVLLLI